MGGTISFVAEDSPFYDAGFEPGCVIYSVNGETLRDVIDWRWLTSDALQIEVAYRDNDGDCGTITLERDSDEPWGVEFSDYVFDGIKLCKNTCTFCFMAQLPRGMRKSLFLRDDDFRLSFLGGTYVTLTNITPEDEARIIEQHLSPLYVSLHAVNPQVRASLVGKNAAHGLEVFERLLAAGIEARVQIVLLPHENDGEVLRETLAWALDHPGILDVGVVPLGYTKFGRFTESFNDPDRSAAVVRLIDEFREKAQTRLGHPWVYAADEFFHNAAKADTGVALPDASYYGEFSMFEDGIGLARSFADDWSEAHAMNLDGVLQAALDRVGKRAYFVCGQAMNPLLSQLIEQSRCSSFVPLYVTNDYFGGNVDVTGLLCGCDVVRAINAVPDKSASAFFLPRVMFNDDGVTLDDLSAPEIARQTGASVSVVSCDATSFIPEIVQYLGK